MPLLDASKVPAQSLTASVKYSNNCGTEQNRKVKWEILVIDISFDIVINTSDE